MLLVDLSGNLCFQGPNHDIMTHARAVKSKGSAPCASSQDAYLRAFRA
jgi:hypothetical protein